MVWLAVAAVVAMAGTDCRAQSKPSRPSTTNLDTLYQDQPTRLQKSNRMWEQNDMCGKESFRKFPDFTAEAAAARDTYMRDCLRKHHLPPRNDVATPLGPRP